MKILLVAVGSGLGGVLRYLVPCWIGTAKGFPWAMLTVNVVGSLLIGLLSGLLARRGGFGPVPSFGWSGPKTLL